MAYNKVVYGGNTLIDLTGDTVAPGTLRRGETAHGADGQPISGTMDVVTYYTGTSDPTAGLGGNGDIYLKVVS